MTMQPAAELRGKILTSEGWVHGLVRFGAHVRELVPVAGAVDDGDLPIVLPGFIDLHVHGGGGADIMDGGSAPQRIAATHARHGTTSLLATTMTAPIDEIAQALTAVAAACAQRQAGAARVLGVHLEGPYINAGKLGAQPDCARVGMLDEMQRLMGLAPIRLVTIAPEVDGHLDLVHALSGLGLRVQIGHTLGSYEEGVAALAQGASGFTHLFNAMTGLHHRAPGMVGAALAHARFAEIIPDLLHVHPGAIRVALRSIPQLYCVTDSTSATGMPDGAYRLGRNTVHKCLGGVRLADGTLAGSVLTMDQALRNLVGLGLSVSEASDRTARFAAEFLGLPDRGRIAVGAWADLVVLDRDLQVSKVFVEGEEIEIANAS